MRSKSEESAPAVPAWARVARGAKAGLRWSLVLCAIAVVQSLAGSPRLRGGPPLPVILTFYAAAGTALGALTAALVPLTRYLLGTIVVCALWGFTLYSGAAVIVNGAAAYTPRVPLLLGGALGVVTGFVVWRAVRAGDPPPAA